jgi:hypothetical protein
MTDSLSALQVWNLRRDVMAGSTISRAGYATVIRVLLTGEDVVTSPNPSNVSTCASARRKGAPTPAPPPAHRRPAARVRHSLPLAVAKPCQLGKKLVLDIVAGD